jgi:diguanylate cyclase (GGDEF)-like protein
MEAKARLTSQTGKSPLRVLICDKDSQQRWLVRTCLLQQLQGEVVTDETDDISQVRIAITRGKVDLLLVSTDAPENHAYWLRRILESQSVPVVMLVDESSEGSAAQLYGHGPVSCLPVTLLTKRNLTDAIEGAMKKWQALKRVVAHRDEVDKVLNVDPLTGLLNRNAVLRGLEQAMKRAGRFGEPLSVVLIDVDRIAEVNLGAGRAAADSALRGVAAVLSMRIRDTDLRARYGGDEFLIVFPHTDRDAARNACERIRSAVAALELKDENGRRFSVTVSAGVTVYEPGDDLASIAYRVEERLCAAKQNGRNRTEW